MAEFERLLARVQAVRRRWRMRQVVRGTALLLASLAALVILGIFGADLFGFSSAAVVAARLFTGVATLLCAARLLLLPLRRFISDVQVAQYVEERYPHLQDRLVTAVEFGGQPAGAGLVDLLIKDALDKTRHVDLSVFVNRRQLAYYGALAAAALVAPALLFFWGPSFFSYGIERLYMPWAEASTPAPLAIEVEPGDREIARGADQQVEARLIGFDSPEVRLLTQSPGSAAWSQSVMDPQPRGSVFRYLLADVQASLRYCVESEGVRSQVYSLRVLDKPGVEKIDLTYNFPRYTGMQPQTAEDEGDMVALKGTRVEIRIRLSQPADSAGILFDSGTSLALGRTGEREFAGSLVLRASGSYVVRLADARAGSYVASREYTIEALDDSPPRIAITKPLRDVKATNVEEVLSEARAEDDFGLGRMELRYSVNAGPERTVILHDGKPPLSTVTGTHTFFLEEFGLQPGDLIAYFAKAQDNNDVSGPGTSTSDLYFIEVRPFEQKYTQSQQGASGSGAGGAEEALSRQQKEVIAATFRLIRDEGKLDPKEFADDLKALALVQSRLQAQAQNIVQRLQRRGAVSVDDNFAKMTAYLNNAVAAMESAAARLGAQKPAEALPDEQKALQQLMRAEGLFREIQVSFGSRGGQGGGSANAEDLADLFELELNKLKNQYETIQRGEQSARDQQLDEATRRLKELARRQQQINERNLQLGQRMGGAQGSQGGGQGQQQLLDEASRLQRQLQKLSRERSSPELDRVGGQLRQAIEEMRRALERTRKGEGKESAAQGIRALQRLDEAGRSLARAQDAGLNDRLDRALAESGRLLEEQKRIADGIERLGRAGQQAGGEEDEKHRQEIGGRKALLAESLRGLAKEIEDLSRQARGSQRETSARLSDAAGVIRDRRLPERVLSAGQLLQGGYTDFAKAREESIRGSLEELNRQLEAARNSIGQSAEGRLEDAHDRARRLAEGLESMQGRLQGRVPGGRPQDRRAGRDTQSGQQGAQDRESPQSSAQQDAAGQSGRSDLAGAEDRAPGPGGQRQPSPAGGSPTTDASGRTADAAGPPLGVGGHRDEDIRQLRRELQQRISDADELRRLLDRNSTQADNLNQVIASLRRMGAAEDLGDPEEVSRLRSAVRLLRQVETDLSRELGLAGRRDQALHTDENEAPRNFRKLVEEYYRALARGRP